MYNLNINSNQYNNNYSTVNRLCASTPVLNENKSNNQQISYNSNPISAKSVPFSFSGTVLRTELSSKDEKISIRKLQNSLIRMVRRI